MTRPPDPNSKVVRVFLTAKPGEETKLRAFKEICARNDIKVRNVLMEKVDSFLRKHNWPPGNSQTLIGKFTAPKLNVEKKCRRIKPHPSDKVMKGYEGWCPLHEKWVTKRRCIKCPSKR